MEEKFTPEIIAFCCHYCAYAAADLAGSMRLNYPASIKVIEMPCTGKVDPIYITVDINIKVQKELEEFFDFEETRNEPEEAEKASAE